MRSNLVSEFFIALAKFNKIEIDHKWKSELVKKIGPYISIKHPNLIAAWILRGYLPEHFINKISALKDIPDFLKKLCKNCEKIPLRSENHTPGEKNSLPCIGEHSKNYEKAITELFSLIKNPKMASKFAQNLLCVIKKDPERFYDNFYSRIIGDCDMLKDLKENRRKHLRILK